MPRIVVDTSVFVSALKSSRGGSREVLRRCLLRQHQSLMGTALLTEYEDVLARPGLFANCPLTNSERNALLNAFLSVCEWRRVYFGWRPNLTDEKDNHLIELAVAGGANAIVTHNVRHLIQAELRFPQIQILTPEQFLLVSNP